MYTRRAAVPASPDADTPSQSIKFLPLLSLSILAFLAIFFAVRLFRRNFHMPSLARLRGKGRGTKNRLGISGVELLPTSVKPTSTLKTSPFSASFNLEGNAGKSVSKSPLSRSSSLDALPRLTFTTPSPPMGSPPRSSSRTPFTLPIFMKPKRRSPHKRSKSLGVSHRQTPSMSSSSAPPSPSPNHLLIDFSSSSSSNSASSDLGVHKIPSMSSPLIPGIPVPVSSPPRPSAYKAHTFPVISPSHPWAFDDETEDGVNSSLIDPLLAAFKRNQAENSNLNSQAEDQPLIQYEHSFSMSHDTPSAVSMPPKRLSTTNPFASYSPSRSPQKALPPSPLALSPTFPPGIELVPIKAASTLASVSIVHPIGKLVDYDVEGSDESDIGRNPISPSVPQGFFHSPPKLEIITNLDAPGPDTRGTHIPMQTMLSEVNASPSHTDPFDDVYAVPLAAADLYGNGTPASSHVEEAPSFAVEFDQSLAVVPLHSSPPPIVPQEQAEAVEVDPESPTSSWQWDGRWSPLSGPSRQAISDDLIPPDNATAARNDGTGALLELDQNTVLFEPDKVIQANRDMNSLRHRESPKIDITAELRPVDTWFIEEPTAVWDSSWTLEKDDALEDGHDQEEHVNFADSVFLEPSETVEIHILDEQETETTDTPKEPQNKYNNDFIFKYESNDNNDTLIPCSINTTPVIVPATPILASPCTPSTLSPTMFGDVQGDDRHSDPDLLPLPDLPLFPSDELFSALSQPGKSQQSIRKPLSQTPTPPASPPPSHHTPTHPLRWPPAADVPSLATPSAATILAPEATFSMANTLLTTGNPEDVQDHGENETTLEQVAQPPPELSESIREETNLKDAHSESELPGSFPSAASPLPGALSSPEPLLVTTSKSATSASPSSSSATVPKGRVVALSTTRLRTPRSAIDLALAMQLRPGLGAGADPAWMVRFLMALFGWMAVVLSGGEM